MAANPRTSAGTEVYDSHADNQWSSTKATATVTLHVKTPKDPRNTWYHRYNPFSRMLFCWIDLLILKGFKGQLTEDDLYTCPSEVESSKLYSNFEKYWAAEKEKTSPKLWVAIAKCLSWRLIVQGIVSSLLVLGLICQSILLGYLTEYFTIADPSAAHTTDAYLFGTGLCLVSFSLIIINGLTGFYGFKLGMIVRIMVNSALYEKMVKLNPASVNLLTVGHLLNLSSNDIHRFDQALLFLHFLWIAPIHLAAVTCFVYLEIGPTAFLGAALVLGQVPLQYMLGKIFVKLRLKAAKMTDQRILIMNEIIIGIRVIKMYGWEYAFNTFITNIRRKEVKQILKGCIIRVLTLSYYSISLPTMMFVIFATYVSIDNKNTLTPKKVFTTLSLFIFVRLVTLNFLVNGILQVFEARVALKRISAFLLYNTEKNKSKNEDDDEQTETKTISKSRLLRMRMRPTSATSIRSQGKADQEELTENIGLLVHRISASWSMERNDVEILLNVSFKLDKNNPLLAVVGAVGAGKSTLLQCIMNELPPLRGSITVKGSIAYVSQEPWIFSDTLRANILFGLEYDQCWYSTVIEACGLDKDIDQLTRGDLTLIGERGVTLSGGQKARINLARAVYRNADVYLLDDPLSAVDAAVSRHIFDRCIRGLLSDSCVVLVTHQLQYLQQCDRILGLKEGCVTLYGDPEDILDDDTDILTLIGGQDQASDDPRHQYAVRRFSFDQTTTNPNTVLSTVTQPHGQILMITIKEEDGTGSDEGSDDLFPTKSLPILTFELSNDNNIPKSEFLGEAGSIYSAPPLSRPLYTTSSHTLDQSTPAVNSLEDTLQGTVSAKTYLKYFIAGGGYCFTVLVFVAFILAECCVVVTDWWMADWADCNEDTINSTQIRCFLPDNTRIGTYFGLLSSVWVFCILRTLLFYVLSLKSARMLHNKMFMSIIRAPIVFFDTNTTGRILNRFSKDIGFLDDVLIYTFCEFLQLFARFIGIMVTSVIANYIMIIMVVILCSVFLLFRWYYLRTARSIKRIEALSRSPLYSHISTTLQGLVTIRACKMVDTMISEFHKYHNKHTQAWYLYIVSSRWFGMRIDLISSIFLTAVVLISIPLASSLNPGLVGLALTYSISLNGMFQHCVRQSAEVESLMVSTERVIAYTEDIESEASLETQPNDKPSHNWPCKGEIVLSDLSYRHMPDSPLVLKGISATIKAGEKVGIVGRTGAGKSSLVAALFRLAEPTGSIKIDGLVTTSLGLHDIRTKISIIPQDPVLFTGTIRYNLDPFNTYTDNDIWIALEQVQLKLTVECLEEGLDSPVSEGGSNFSVGQKQLFCLARALLRNNKILIMDEATANVDLETDAIIQVVIREQFKDCTVLAIAHRLDTVMDCDKIMVLKFGELVEFNIPHILLSNPNSYLLRLVDHTGPIAAERLKEMALKAYNNQENNITIHYKDETSFL